MDCEGRGWELSVSDSESVSSSDGSTRSGWVHPMMLLAYIVTVGYVLVQYMEAAPPACGRGFSTSVWHGNFWKNSPLNDKNESGNKWTTFRHEINKPNGGVPTSATRLCSCDGVSTAHHPPTLERSCGRGASSCWRRGLRGVRWGTAGGWGLLLAWIDYWVFSEWPAGGTMFHAKAFLAHNSHIMCHTLLNFLHVP